MPRPRTPLAKAQLTGAAAHDPQRFRDRSEPASKPIGAPPASLSPEARRAWKDFRSEWSWLTQGDRAALVPLCELRAIIEGPGGVLNVNALREYRLLLSSFGGTPTTRTKIFEAKAEEDADPFEAFDGGKSH